MCIDNYFLGKEGFKYDYDTCLQGATASAALVTGVSLVSTLLPDDWARVSTPARHYFQHISLLQIYTRILHSMLCWALVSTQPVGKCQSLAYIKSCNMLDCQAVALPHTEQIVSHLSVRY